MHVLWFFWGLLLMQGWLNLGLFLLQFVFIQKIKKLLVVTYKKGLANMCSFTKSDLRC
jgi:hypothetical protein